MCHSTPGASNTRLAQSSDRGRKRRYIIGVLIAHQPVYFSHKFPQQITWSPEEGPSAKKKKKQEKQGVQIPNRNPAPVVYIGV